MDSTNAKLQSIENSNELAPFVMLECQFRMAPLLRSIASKLFYGSRLEDADVVNGRGPIESVALTPLVVIDLKGTTMSFSKLHQSYANHGDAFIVKELYNWLFSSKTLRDVNT